MEPRTGESLREKKRALAHPRGIAAGTGAHKEKLSSCCQLPVFSVSPGCCGSQWQTAFLSVKS